MPLTAQQRIALQRADRDGRALVTTIDGRIAIILPPSPPDKTAEHLARITAALEGLDLS